MYCRTCGNKMNDNAELCVKCGVKKNVGTEYCQVCGTRTTANMTACNKCGAKLLTAMSSTQIKKKAVSTGKKTLGTVLLVLGIILLFIVVANTFVGFMTGGLHSAIENLSDVNMCTIFGCFFIGIGTQLRKK